MEQERKDMYSIRTAPATGTTRKGESELKRPAAQRLILCARLTWRRKSRAPALWLGAGVNAVGLDTLSERNQARSVGFNQNSERHRTVEKTSLFVSAVASIETV